MHGGLGGSVGLWVVVNDPMPAVKLHSSVNMLEIPYDV